MDQEGIATGTDYSRLNLRTNIESQVSDRIKIGLNIAPSVSWSNGGRVDGKDSQSHIVLSATPVAEPKRVYILVLNLMRDICGQVGRSVL